ncbi:hypothetical protein MJG53_002596 [Ovis ammon polii x Ovis aries]|uniref:Uncharacterized protein n=1 Tax=Ovis ammon polii x Ovis aries TaxID=2918886 RepID=A0ACB9VEW9_9CETA|nr:hypothetical protein MJG53_002596 [Ovis ammon polii x Ovis aries]
MVPFIAQGTFHTLRSGSFQSCMASNNDHLKTGTPQLLSPIVPEKLHIIQSHKLALNMPSKRGRAIYLETLETGLQNRTSITSGNWKIQFGEMGKTLTETDVKGTCWRSRNGRASLSCPLRSGSAHRMLQFPVFNFYKDIKSLLGVVKDLLTTRGYASSCKLPASYDSQREFSDNLQSLDSVDVDASPFHI